MTAFKYIAAAALVALLFVTPVMALDSVQASNERGTGAAVMPVGNSGSMIAQFASDSVQLSNQRGTDPEARGYFSEDSSSSPDARQSIEQSRENG